MAKPEWSWDNYFLKSSYKNPWLTYHFAEMPTPKIPLLWNRHYPPQEMAGSNKFYANYPICFHI